MVDLFELSLEYLS